MRSKSTQTAVFKKLLASELNTLTAPGDTSLVQSKHGTESMMRLGTLQHKGFTLIEVMVVVAIIGILAAVAWPLFNQESIKNRRTEAISTATKIANELQDYHADNKTFVGYAISAAITNNLKYYTAVVSNPTATQYTLTLTPTGSQVDDTECTTLFTNEMGVKGFTGSAPSAARCWGTNN